MKLNAKAILSGLILAGSLSAVHAQTTTTTTPVQPASPPTNSTPRADDPTGVNSPARGPAGTDQMKGSDSMKGSDKMMNKRESDAAYADAKRQCSSMSGQAKSDCMMRAREDHKNSADQNNDGRRDGSREQSAPAVKQ